MSEQQENGLEIKTTLQIGNIADDLSRFACIGNKKWICLKSLYQKTNVAGCELFFNKNTEPLRKLIKEIETLAIKEGYDKIELEAKDD